ncbi:hypothetical protein diail_668 [Diaporthe ilicicola]|nr:hypothetical protein diail_668 [Diaporthe ilicicola]
MTNKTWFLPPDFTFLPDGEIALGSVIPEPSRPTVTLASLVDHPTIALPETKTLIEKSHSYSGGKSRSTGLDFFANIMSLASATAKTDVSRFKNKSFSTTDHEVRIYSGSFAPSALKAIVALENVKKHVDSGRWGKRCVYVISGLRVTQQGFMITEESGKNFGASLGGEDKRTDGYETAPGIVFAYRLHVIRPKGTGDEEAELFSDRTAFCSGEAEEEEEEMEIVEVNGAALRNDLDVREDGYEILGGVDGDSFVVFRPASGEEGKLKS